MTCRLLGQRFWILVGVFAAVILLPYDFTFDAERGLQLAGNLAIAESGSGKDGDGAGGDSDDDDDDDDDDDNSGSGSSSSGSGSGGDDGGSDSDDDEDEQSGSGGSGDSGSGGSGSGGSGSGSGKNATEDASNDRRSGKTGVASSRRAAIEKVELTAAGVLVRYANGASEEIENGRYKRQDPSGQMVENRQANGTDIARLRRLATGITIKNTRSGGARKATTLTAEISGDSIAVSYSNGWTEQISAGRYALKDPFGRTVANRPATTKDAQRLRSAARP